MAESVVEVRSNQPGPELYVDDKPTGQKTDLNGKAYVQTKTKGLHRFSLIKDARHASAKAVALMEGGNDEPMILSLPEATTTLVMTTASGG